VEVLSSSLVEPSSEVEGEEVLSSSLVESSSEEVEEGEEVLSCPSLAVEPQGVEVSSPYRTPHASNESL